jgi:hypothetical protein
MAIQQVGGQGVYVITGSGRDPRRTSNGQSWADLVTKQKYMLYKSAYDQAMREYEAGAITDKERQKRIDQLRKDIRQERTEIARLERGELTENQLRERQRQRQEAQLGTQRITTRDGTGRAGRTDTGIPTIETYEDKLEKEESKLLQNKTRTNAEVQKLEKDSVFMRAYADAQKGLPLSARKQRAYDSKIQAYENAKAAQTRVQTDLKAKQRELDKVRGFDSQQLFEEYYRTDILKGADPSTTTGGGGGGRGQTITQQVRKDEVPLSDVDYSELIKERQERIGDIEKQILKLEAEPQEELVDVIQRTKEIGEERYGLGQPRRRLFGRRAEMDALGVEQTAEEPVAETVTEATETVEPSLSPLESAMQEGDVDMVMSGQGGMGVQQGPSGVVEGERPRETLDMSAMEMTPPAPTERRGRVAQPMMRTVEDNVDVGPDLRGRATQEEIDRINAFLRPPMQTATVKPSLPPTPMQTPTPTAMPSIRKLGRMRSYKEAMGGKQPQRRRPLPPLQQIRAAFDPVRNLGRREKQQVGMNLLQQAKQAYGVSSPEYQKAKAQVLSELGKALDPKKAKQMKVVKSLQDNAPSQYSRLGDDIRGLSEDSKRMVVQLFPVSDDTKLDEVERLYKNAQQQIRLSIPNKSQKKKALDMLDLMYMAVISDKR